IRLPFFSLCPTTIGACGYGPSVLTKTCNTFARSGPSVVAVGGPTSPNARDGCENCRRCPYWQPTPACNSSCKSVPNTWILSAMRGEMKICETPSAHTCCGKHCPITCGPLPSPPEDGQPQDTRTGATGTPAASINSIKNTDAWYSHHSRNCLTSSSLCGCVGATPIKCIQSPPNLPVYTASLSP